MYGLSDSIEDFIKKLMQEQEQVEIQRNELAQYFRCAPSQINYVLTTRFSPVHGYIVQSRRGGGGYIRVLRVKPDRNEQITQLLTEELSQPVGNRTANAIIKRLLDSELITLREARMMSGAVSDKILNFPVEIRDGIRAAILRNMIIALLME